MKLFLLLLLVIETLSIEMNKIYMIKAEMQDDSVSDAKYIYNTDSLNPTGYIQTSNLKYPSENYEVEQLNYPSYDIHIVPPSKEELRDIKSAGGGKEYSEEYYSRKGEKGQTGYDKEQTFDKGINGKHENVENNGYYKENGGNNKNYLDDTKNYASKYDYHGGYDGGYSKKWNDNKHDVKTKGYHKLFNKDEYKKKHTFYDESNTKGQFNKYGDQDKYHLDKSGGFKNGKSGNAGYYEDYYGEKGQHDKGHYLDNDSKYKSEKGDGKYYRDYKDYAKRGSNSDNERSSYSESEKS